MTNTGLNLFPHASELFISAFEKKSYLIDLGNCTSSISQLVPWSILTRISIENGTNVTAAELEAILRTAHNIDTLRISDEDGVLPRAILRNEDGLGDIVNRQVSICLFKEKYQSNLIL